MKKYTGKCHCGAVQFEIEADITKVMSCNCSICSKHGLLLIFLKAPQVKIISGEDNLTEYRFNKKTIRHLFCKTCGIEPFGRGEAPNGEETYAINVRCLDGIDMDSLTVTPFNGKDL